MRGVTWRGRGVDVAWTWRGRGVETWRGDVACTRKCGVAVAMGYVPNLLHNLYFLGENILSVSIILLTVQ